ncbi:MAG: hypothetical protein IJD88_06890, partial [Clostridia bacterium]|nr:hypothetical protein [Clostridia bacterium]
IRTELETVKKDSSVPLTEDIGNDIVRVNFAAINDKISAEAINKCFILSANEIKGSVESFESKISEIFALCKDGQMPFSKKELTKYMEEYKKIGYPPVSHSETYRKEYSPAYRIIKKEYADILEAVSAIDQKSETKKVIVAIDGRCASGKSTIAGNLNKIFNCQVVHMDDFFLPYEKRTPERLAEPGGNIDYERFESEVLTKIRNEKEFSYGIFDCSTGKIESERTIKPSKITIVEGSYSLHPRFGNSYDVKVFVLTDYETQLQRIINRNGEKMLKLFKEKWIPMEENYFNAFDIETLADIKLNT